MSEQQKSRSITSQNGNSSYCKVCGDRASGKHYGVPSCDGCRGFFKRSIRRNLEYTCKEGGKCIVDVSRRNQCQACRFAKCLAANMRPEAVQHERAPRSCMANTQLANGLAPATAASVHLDAYSLNRRVPLHHHHSGLILPIPMHMPTTFTSSLEPPRYYPQFGAFHPNVFDSLNFGASSRFSAANTLVTGSTGKPTSAMETATTIRDASSIVHPIPTTMLKSFYTKKDSDSVYSHATDSSSSSILAPPSMSLSSDRTSGNRSDAAAKEDEVSSSEEILRLHNLPSVLHVSNVSAEHEIIFESAAKLLFLAVKWAKSTPSFNQIGLQDQNLLLEECWAELFVIMSAQYGLPISNLLIAPNDLTTRKLQRAIHQILLLRLNHTEITCLKTLTLFRPDCSGLASPYEISMLQNEALNLLLETCGGSRMGHILLTLPHIRSAADRQVIQELLFKKIVGEVAIEKLLGELMRN